MSSRRPTPTPHDFSQRALGSGVSAVFAGAAGFVGFVFGQDSNAWAVWGLVAGVVIQLLAAVSHPRSTL
jgi:hypothetical protein